MRLRVESTHDVDGRHSTFGGMPTIAPRHAHLETETSSMPFATHEEYFASLPAAVRTRLEQIQAEVERRVPGAIRCISYNVPAFKVQRTFFYFAAFKKHIGVYPPVTEDQALMAATARFRGPKGNLSFPLSAPLPLELIGRVAVALAAQHLER
jgi:uncharacterized protein YdhG (YjbR/CyaY superfamily)